MPSKRKDGSKSKTKGTRPKSGARLPLLQEKGRREKAFEVFLNAYRLSGMKQRSAALAGVSCRAIQKWRQEFPEFEERFEDAHAEYVESLKEEVHRRAVIGWDEPVFQKGECVGTIRKYDSNLLMFLTKQAEPSFRDSSAAAQVNIANTVANNNTINSTHRIIEDADWYGNDAHDLATKAITTHAPSAALTSEIQTTGLRETLEQNSNGNAGSIEGARIA